jgi:AhpC/TSA family
MRFVTLLALLGSGTFESPVRDIDGRTLTPFQPSGIASVLFFVMSDCPVSNAYAPEIQRLCRSYQAHGVGCSLIYEDVAMEKVLVRRHLEAYGYEGIPAVVDATREVASTAGVSITPTAVLVDRRRQIRYRGRIDNLYASLGRTRVRVTEHYLKNALDSVLANRRVLTPETTAIGCHVVPARPPERPDPPRHTSH